MKHIFSITTHACHCEGQSPEAISEKVPQSLLWQTMLAVCVSFFAMILLLPSISLADAEKIFRENNKAVVVVISYDSKGNPIGQGSGFVVREDGVIATNYHVISNAADIRIKAGNKMFKVKGFLHIDKENDVVILKADAKGLLSVKIGDINKANVGEKVYVISSPQGLENTISDGILSGLREITSVRKILQITAPVSEGSSGGPVFNKNSEAIGIATFIIKEAQNLNFAMPINLIKDKISSKKVIALKDAEIIDYKKTAGYWFNLGYYYDEAGLYDDAIEAYTSVIAIDPNGAAAYNNRGVAYANKGQHDRAIEDYNKAIALNPNGADAYNNRGVAYAFQEQWAYLERATYERAIADYNKAIALNPNYAAAYINRGSAYGFKGQHDRAIEDYNKAIALNPNDAAAYSHRGFAYYHKGQYDRAIADYNKAIALNPNYALAYFNLALVYSKKEQYDRAIMDFQKACDMGLTLACKFARDFIRKYKIPQ